MSCSSGSLPLVHPHRLPLAIEAGPSLDELTPFEVGSEWGPPWGTTWFRLTRRRTGELVGTPDRGDHRHRVRRRLAGLPVRGARSGRRWPPGSGHPPPAPGRTHRRRERQQSTSSIEAASNPMFPQFQPSLLGSPDTAGDKQLYRFNRADLVVVDPDGEALLHDLNVLDGVMRELPVRDPRRTAAAAHRRARARCRRGRRRARRRPRHRRPGARHCRPGRARTTSSPPATRTSTRRGCGRSARPCASASARSPRPST